MTEEDQNLYKTAQEVYQKVLSNTKYLENNWKGLIKLIIGNVSEVGQIDGNVNLKSSSYRPGAGYKAEIFYSFLGNNIGDILRDDKSISDKEALEEAVSNLRALVDPLGFSKNGGESQYIENVSITGPILEKSLEEYEESPEAPRRDIAVEDVKFLKAVTDINLDYIRKRDIPKMRIALQERFPDNYGKGQDNDLGKFKARQVISVFREKLRYVEDRLKS